MKSLDKDLVQLAELGQISAESAVAKANDPNAVRSKVGMV